MSSIRQHKPAPETFPIFLTCAKSHTKTILLPSAVYVAFNALFRLMISCCILELFAKMS